jgi:hypothetical protein
MTRKKPTERDELKNVQFQMAGAPLIRIRTDDTRGVRSEDFYDLLEAKGAQLSNRRPRRFACAVSMPAGVSVC